MSYAQIAEEQIVGVMRIMNLSRLDAIDFLMAQRLQSGEFPDKREVLQQLKKETQIAREGAELNGGEGI